jgi:hypothetical protein
MKLKISHIKNRWARRLVIVGTFPFMLGAMLGVAVAMFALRLVAVAVVGPIGQLLAILFPLVVAIKDLCFTAREAWR